MRRCWVTEIKQGSIINRKAMKWRRRSPSIFFRIRPDIIHADEQIIIVATNTCPAIRRLLKGIPKKVNVIRLVAVSVQKPVSPPKFKVLNSINLRMGSYEKKKSAI